MNPSDTLAHYIAFLPELAHCEDDHAWLWLHARRILDQHTILVDRDRHGNDVFILDDASAVRHELDNDAFHVHRYHPDQYPGIQFPKQSHLPRSEELITAQYYAACIDLAETLQISLAEAAQAMPPGSRHHSNLLRALHQADRVYWHLAFYNDAPLIQWMKWCHDHEFWLQGALMDPDPSISKQATIADVAAMLAVAGQICEPGQQIDFTRE